MPRLAATLLSMREGEDSGDNDDLSADGPIACRIRRDLATRAPQPRSHFTVARTGDTRGLGLYAEVPMQAGSYLFDYTGEHLDEEEYVRRYPGDAHADYVVGVERSDGSLAYVDACSETLSGLARFLNHDGADPNCVMWTLAEEGCLPRLLMCIARDVAVGEELVWDYGEAYWRNRSDMI